MFKIGSGSRHGFASTALLTASEGVSSNEQLSMRRVFPKRNAGNRRTANNGRGTLVGRIMLKFCQSGSFLCMAAVLGLYAGAEIFVSDPGDPLFRELSNPVEFDESEYGAGPLLVPGRTLYVKPAGDDNADGLSWESAIRLGEAFRRVEPGDTILVGEGTYYDDLPDIPSGEAGRPVRIFAAPRHRVIICPSKKAGPFRKTPGYEYVCEIDLKKPANIELYTATWEEDSRRVLEVATSIDHVEELPGTFYFDKDNDRMYVRFSDGRPGEGRYVYVLNRHRGIKLHPDSRYIHIKGLWFKHAPFYGLGIFGHNHTVEDCVFFANWGQGLRLMRASRCLIRNNYGFSNEERGTIMTASDDTIDNLIIGNRAEHSRPTGRSGLVRQRHAINNYGLPGRQVHIVNNIMDDEMSFRWKAAIPESIFQGNVCTGRVVGEWWDKDNPGNGIVLRANTILDGVGWFADTVGLGPGGWRGNWYAPDKAAFDNFSPDGDVEEIKAARFADPAYLDYRLQSDSPLRGKASGGRDLGAFPYGDYRIYYAGLAGSDENPGGSERLAFRTLEKAASVLKPGDTLYVLEGKYAAPLRVSISGTEEEPIRVRAFNRQRVVLPGIEINGSWICVEGFEVAGAKRAGIRVLGGNVKLKNCIVRDAGGSAVHVKAPGFTLNHCTLIYSREGLKIDADGRGATVRNSIIAFNREAPVRIEDGALASYRGYNNCYFGPGAEIPLPEVASIIADPEFADADRGDYRVRWDSPCVYLGEFREPAGARGVVPRELEIADVRTSNVQRDHAVVSWRTPEEDSTGRLRYRVKGESRWHNTERTLRGTRHASALIDLVPETDYEVQVESDGRFGSRAYSGTFILRTARVSRRPLALYVAPDGDDDADGRSPGTAWRTIRRANMGVMPGDTVFIAAGVYSDSIRPITGGLPDARITYKKHGSGEVIIDSGEVHRELVNLEGRSHVTIDGLTFVSHISSGTAPSVFFLIHCEDIQIRNCRTRNTGPRRRRATVETYQVQGLRLEGNVFSQQRYIVYAFTSNDFVIKDNTFAYASVYHLGFSNVDNVRVFNNVFYQRAEGGRGAPYIDFRVRSTDYNIEMDHNIYRPAPRMEIVNIRLRNGRVVTHVHGDTLERWQEASGMDKNSLYEDPLFVNPGEDDFRLQPGSPALGSGTAGSNIGALGIE